MAGNSKMGKTMVKKVMKNESIVMIPVIIVSLIQIVWNSYQYLLLDDFHFPYETLSDAIRFFGESLIEGLLFIIPIWVVVFIIVAVVTVAKNKKNTNI